MIGEVTNKADVERKEGLLRIGEVGEGFVCFHATNSPWMISCVLLRSDLLENLGVHHNKILLIF